MKGTNTINTQIGIPYFRAKSALSLLTSSYGADIVENEPELLPKLIELIGDMEEATMDFRLEEADMVKVNEDIAEAYQLLSVLPDTSQDSRKQISNILKDLNNKLHNALGYNAKFYFANYFYQLSSPADANPKLNLDNRFDSPSVSKALRRQLLDSEEFKTWFGNSQVVDDSGKPRIMFHGTSSNAEFTKFRFDIFPGIYFAQNRKYAEYFLTIKQQPVSTMFQCYLRIQNPMDLSEFSTEKVTYYDLTTYIELRYGYKLPENPLLKAVSDAKGGMEVWKYLRGSTNWLKYIIEKKEFDGIEFYENNPDQIINKKEAITKAWMVFQPNQIKSADYRNLSFSIQSPDVRFDKGGKV